MTKLFLTPKFDIQGIFLRFLWLWEFFVNSRVIWNLSDFSWIFLVCHKYSSYVINIPQMSWIFLKCHECNLIKCHKYLPRCHNFSLNVMIIPGKSSWCTLRYIHCNKYVETHCIYWLNGMVRRSVFTMFLCVPGVHCCSRSHWRFTKTQNGRVGHELDLTSKSIVFNISAP